MDIRELKGLEIAARKRVVFRNGMWHVPSQSGEGTYKVCLDKGKVSCQCDDFELRQEPCKHVHAARLVRDRDNDESGPALDLKEVPRRPTYKQDWPAYNLAQTTEKHRFQELLHDLCRGLPERPQPRTGRRPTPLADMVFACAFKVYSTVSTRRFNCDLNDACGKGFLSRPVHPMSVCDFLQEPTLTPVLKELIVRSSLPLRTVETMFAVDSTGFSTSRFRRWYDEKYGVTRSEHNWVKAHITCGVKSNVVTVVEILGRDANDSPVLRPMIEETAKHFRVSEVSADKAYLSHANLEAVDRLGGTAYIPFKTNSLPNDGLWGRMYGYYQFRREEFLRHYHRRSNVETVFSMVKAKFRDHVRSRDEVAMVNEVLCKFLCHNICVVHQSHIELGIEGEFWPGQ